MHPVSEPNRGLPEDGLHASRQNELRDRFAGVLLGTALGDALGLPMEGMHASVISRLFPQINRFNLLGRVGFVSDDTEQSALLAQSLVQHPHEKANCVRAFRRALLGWFLRLPWGIGFGTLKACVRIALGFSRSGVSSAGNGAAMRAAILGAFFFDDERRRREWSDEIANVTHRDRRAVDGATYVAELAAYALRGNFAGARSELVESAAEVVKEPSLRSAIASAQVLAKCGAEVSIAARELGNTGFANHTIALATFCFLRFGDNPESAIIETIRAGGDTDSNAAIVGAWVGALYGEQGLPTRLMKDLHDGPFGSTHLRALADDLAQARCGVAKARARFSWPCALMRNLLLWPVNIVHAFRMFFAGMLLRDRAHPFRRSK